MPASVTRGQALMLLNDHLGQLVGVDLWVNVGEYSRCVLMMQGVLSHDPDLDPLSSPEDRDVVSGCYGVDDHELRLDELEPLHRDGNDLWWYLSDDVSLCVRLKLSVDGR
jgi:hypothetical protein